ncbi:MULTISPECIES: helix-turn-helix transcriptional regulator [unclassified Paenibacillus]|uniref:helix-turn-helix transcriptional regulator n=1 Tax=unclassified Paenibacillus TaxID=185978 RepID=UPI00041A1D65|nr:MULTISPECIES: YafY family protein [unclassified Paenibacillus]EAU0476200.1 YafY family transcriptional regulator [Salmonella enterica]OPG97122.1 transcriptional regulator [Chryseobacterium mucoviscidosis]EAU0476319.1 YafY family transcriptional regulator [Salmonella enterica]KGP79248.1 transcriptional regulator [Paenibacillus sp. MAEPY2]KGP85419.1 transcriptional regulator [Paenibacillus sp. MAEPY1]
MKLDRLLAIVVLLINRGRVQAKDLADTFEVSIRTIYRDIDTLGQAGIPVVTYQGASGGIGLAEGYRLDRNVLTDKDLASIVTALRSVSTSHTNVARDLLMEKLSSIVPEAKNEDFQANTSRFIVDYSMWTHPEALQIKLQLIEQGMDQLRPITFTYCSAEGTQTHRTTDPHTLVLKKHSWYLYAFCHERNEFRMFKLVRMRDVALAQGNFERKPINLQDRPWQQDWATPDNKVPLTLRFHARIRHIAVEWFGIESVIPDDEGYYISQVAFPEDNWLYGFILGFGADVEVLEPLHIREEIRRIAEQIVQNYNAPPRT